MNHSAIEISLSYLVLIKFKNFITDYQKCQCLCFENKMYSCYRVEFSCLVIQDALLVMYIIHTTYIPRRYFCCGSFFFLCLLCICARLFVCALWSPAWKGLTSWLSFVAYNCEFVTFQLVSLARCGTLLYRFLIFAPLLTFIGPGI